MFSRSKCSSNTHSRQSSQASSDLTECKERERLNSAITYLDEAIFHMLFNFTGNDWNKIMNIIC